MIPGRTSSVMETEPNDIEWRPGFLALKFDMSISSLTCKPPERKVCARRVLESIVPDWQVNVNVTVAQYNEEAIACPDPGGKLLTNSKEPFTAWFIPGTNAMPTTLALRSTTLELSSKSFLCDYLCSYFFHSWSIVGRTRLKVTFESAKKLPVTGKVHHSRSCHFVVPSMDSVRQPAVRRFIALGSTSSPVLMT